MEGNCLKKCCPLFFKPKPKEQSQVMPIHSEAPVLASLSTPINQNTLNGNAASTSQSSQTAQFFSKNLNKKIGYSDDLSQVQKDISPVKDKDNQNASERIEKQTDTSLGMKKTQKVDPESAIPQEKDISTYDKGQKPNEIQLQTDLNKTETERIDVKPLPYVYAIDHNEGENIDTAQSKPLQDRTNNTKSNDVDHLTQPILQNNANSLLPIKSDKEVVNSNERSTTVNGNDNQKAQKTDEINEGKNDNRVELQNLPSKENLDELDSKNNESNKVNDKQDEIDHEPVGALDISRFRKNAQKSDINPNESQQESSNHIGAQKNQVDQEISTSQQTRHPGKHVTVVSKVLDISACSDVSHSVLNDYEEHQKNIREGELFVYISFPADKSSISTDASSYCHSKVEKWSRIPQIYSNFSLFGEKIEPCDVQQGGLGDCYLLTSFGVLAQKPELLKRIFHSKTIMKSELYAIWIYDSGHLRLIELDDYIPCGKDGNPSFSRSKTGAIWVLLLEKAYAQIFGSYSNIDSGSTAEALNFLTGAPTVEFRFKPEREYQSVSSTSSKTEPREEKMWKFIQEDLSVGYLLTASSLHAQQKETEMKSGIISDHAYGLYDAKILKVLDGKAIRAVKLRNPWGQQDLHGSCKENSRLIFSELKKQYNIDPDSDPGMFWIDYEDFCQNFQTVTCCKVHEDYKYKFLSPQIYQWGDWGLLRVKLTVKKPGLVYVSVHQPIERSFKKLSPKDTYQYSYLRILLVELEKDGRVKRFVKGKFRARQQLVLAQDLSPGEYLAFIEVDWKSELKGSRRIVVSTYAQRTVKITEYESEDNPMDLYEKIIRSYIFSGNPSIKVETFQDTYNESKLTLNVKLFQMFKYGLCVYLYSNQEAEATLEFMMTEERPPKNMKIFYPKNASGGLPHVSLEPGKDQIVIIKAISVAGEQQQQNGSFCYASGSIANRYQLKYPLKVLVEKTKEYGKNNISDEIGQYMTLLYGGGLCFYFKNNKANEIVIASNLECEGFLIHDSEMRNIVPNQNIRKVLKEGEDYVLNFEVKRLGENTSSFPNIDFGYSY